MVFAQLTIVPLFSCVLSRSYALFIEQKVADISCVSCPLAHKITVIQKRSSRHEYLPFNHLKSTPTLCDLPWDGFSSLPYVRKCEKKAGFAEGTNNPWNGGAVCKFCNSTCFAGKVVRHWQPANIIQCRTQEALPSPKVSPNRRTEGPGDSRGRNQAAEPAPSPCKRDCPAYLGFKTFLSWM